MNTDIQTQLFSLYQRHQNLWNTTVQSLPTVVFDPEWLSLCQVGDVVDNKITWQAIKREKKVDLSNIEEA